MRITLLALLFVPALLTAGPVSAPPGKRPLALAAPRLDDARWASYFGSQYAIYLAARGVRDLPGPQLNAALRKSEDQLIAAAKPDEVLYRALAAKVIGRPLDLLAGGFALGVTSDNGAARLLAVAARTPAADAFLSWAKTEYTTGPNALTEVEVGGQRALEVRIGGKAQLVIGVDGDCVVIADRAEELAGALKTHASGMLNLAGGRAYGRLRAKVPPSAAAFAVMTPGPELAALIKNDAATMQPGLPATQLIDIAFGTIDGFVFSVSGDARGQLVDMWIGLEAGSESYQKLHLADRAKFYASHALSLAGLAPGDVGAFFCGLQPSFDAAEMPMGLGFVGNEGAPGNQRQWDIFKGQLQMHTGLAFDAEVRPWLGAESALVVRFAGDVPEGAVMFATTDEKATRASLDKAVRHIAISQNREFTGVTFGPVQAQVAKAVPGRAVTPALAVTGGALVMSSSAGLMEAFGTYPLKAGEADPHQRLLKALGGRAVFMMGWAVGPVITRAMKLVIGSAPALPEQVESIGVGLAMPEPELMHGVLSITTK